MLACTKVGTVVTSTCCRFPVRCSTAAKDCFGRGGTHGSLRHDQRLLGCKLLLQHLPSSESGGAWQPIRAQRTMCSASPVLQAPAGSWSSPISSELITSKSIALGAPTFDSKGTAYWMEGRPTEGGRMVLVRRAPGGEAEDVTPGLESGLNVRSRVHEYGGGAWLLADDQIFFSNFADQRLYRQRLYPELGAPEALTAEGSGQRFADGVLDAERQRLIYVVEQHEEGKEAKNFIGAVDLVSGAVTPLAEGADFYSSPQISPRGDEVVYVSWDHPNMPWDETTLWRASVAADGSLTNVQKVAGGPGVNVGTPLWSASGTLYFYSDETGWWNIHAQDTAGQVRCVLPMEADFADPAWNFPGPRFSELPNGKLLCSFTDAKLAGLGLGLLDPESGVFTPLDLPFDNFSHIGITKVGDKLLLSTTAASPTQPSAAMYLELEDVEKLAEALKTGWKIIAKSTNLQLDPGYLSTPRSIEFPTEGGLTAFMLYYPPTNKDYALPPGELPPLLVQIHGGPTYRTTTAFSLVMQYWTSRGFAIADVNYGGSTGYGREFRERLKGQWGVVDVHDCANAAKYLAEQQLADPKKLCIAGGSAGGFTTLACIAFTDVFAVGASHYGVADLELLAKDTHKFESHYLDLLIGPYPQMKALYQARSPIHHLDTIRRPIIFFQGAEDKVVPPEQAEVMHSALKERGQVTALVMFPGEQHGFRQGPNIRTALDGELYFFGKALGFPAAMPSDLPAIHIDNLPEAKC